MDRLFVKDWSAWAPGVVTGKEWDDWASGAREIQLDADKPKLDHLPPIARRRLSQLTRMVLHVGHELHERNGSCKTVLCSRFGEIGQQNGITGNLIDSGEVRPSAFSLSVFNTPVSLLSIHENNIEAATVLLSGEGDLTTGLLSLLADIRLDANRDYMIIFADEMLPEDYRELHGVESYPYAYSLVVGAKESEKGFPIDLELESDDEILKDSTHPLELLRWIISSRKNPFTISGSGCRISLC